VDAAQRPALVRGANWAGCSTRARPHVFDACCASQNILIECKKGFARLLAGDVYVLRIDHERTKAAIAEQPKFSALLKVLRAGLT
jgi:hypothetical protein